MITAVRIKNLRSLADTGFIEIKPLTLLLGANSSGKSTFLRSFPLFTQSVNKNLRGPISWFDDSLVDFGDYNTAINKYAKEGESIQFDYIIKPSYERHYLDYNIIYYDSIESRRPSRSIDYKLYYKLKEAQLSFTLKNDSKGTYINSVSITIPDFVIKVEIAERQGRVQFAVNNYIIETEKAVRLDARSDRSILPTFVNIVKDERNRSVNVRVSEAIDAEIYEFVRQRSDKRLRNFNRVDVYIESWTTKKEDYLFWLKNNAPIASFRNYAEKWDKDNPEFLALYYLIALDRLIGLWEKLDDELSMFYRNCSYIAPARAEANRYYRTQGLQVSGIDSYGKNLAEFISSLTPQMANSYNNYTEKLLGVTVRTKAESGHQCIMISNEKGEYNISDVGFGYSQILPVITKIWYATRSSDLMRRAYLGSTPNDTIILMEQPELHLHPAYQAKIADAFINSVKNNTNQESPLHLIVETHSDTILNRIGRRVREGVIAPEDVNIILFEKGLGENVTRVKQTTYNENGQIKEWPNGFFDPDQD